MILVDTNVIIDALDVTAAANISADRALRHAVKNYGFINEIVVAELGTRARSPSELEVMVEMVALRVEPITTTGCYLAAQAYRQWIANGGRRGVMLPDLLIGAQAVALNARVLTRDARRFKTYFPELTLITPDTFND